MKRRPSHLAETLLVLLVAASLLASSTGLAQTYPWEHDSTIFHGQWFHETGSTGWFRDSHPTLADINMDGDLEVLAGATDCRLYVLDPHSGQPLPGWPQTLTAPIDSSPAVGDVDGDGRPEIVVGCGVADWWNFPQVMPGALYCFNDDGSLLWRHATDDWWNMSNHDPHPDGKTESICAAPVLADVDEDGVLEIIIGAQDGLLYVINADGVSVMADQSGNVVQEVLNQEGRWFGSIYRRDADGDGRWDEDPYGDQTPYPFGDIVPGFRGVDDDGDGTVDEFLALNVDDDEDSWAVGEPVTNLGLGDEDRWEFPFQCRDSVWPAATVADLNGDGHLEIIQSCDVSGQAPNFGQLFVIDRFANPVPGWGYEEVIEEVDALGNHFSHPGRVWGRLYRASAWNQISVGDVDHDGTPELFFGSNRTLPTQSIPFAGFLHGLNHDGSEIRDGDGDPSTWGVFALTGIDPPGTPGACRETINGSPSIGDLDGDGDLEIVAVGMGPFPGSEIGAYNGQPSAGLYAWHHDGTPVAGFPFAPHDGTGPAVSGTILVDLDGDGDLEIIYTTVGSSIEAFHHTGEPVEGAPVFLLDFQDGGG
ncbi:VCBS repeat-containing protein, partial [Candidatus Sumerlaeota bacterium]|nr:VCBS repeat-containing protein [Candidatus Sumerlaeota bacterium]